MTSIKLLRNIVLLIVLFFFLLTGYYYKYCFGDSYCLMPDPEYVYLINGTTIANGQIAVRYIDHPGTTLQYLYAGLIRVISFFQPDDYVIKNVAGNPELYISITNLLLIIINAFCLFIAGLVITASTHNILHGIFAQLSLFAFPYLLGFTARCTPELLLTATSLLLMALIINYVNSFNHTENKKYPILFGLIIGYGIATKITFFPLVFIPLFLIYKSKLKWLYLVALVVSFILFAFPVVLRFNSFYNWIKALFIHSGGYGHGKKNIIDLNIFVSSIKTIWLIYKPFFIFIGINILIILVHFFPYTKRLFKRDLYFKAILGIFTAIIIQLIMVCKHFAPHYIFPALLLTWFSIILIVIKLSLIIPLRKTFLLLVFLFTNLCVDYA